VTATAAAIRAGAAVIYQGTLTGNGGALFGRPDFLVRAELLSAPDGNPPCGRRLISPLRRSRARS